MNEIKIKVWKNLVNYKSFINQKFEKNFLILHGWWGSSDSWVKIWRKISDLWFNVYIPDLPWFGKSELTKVFDIKSYRSLIEAFIDKLSVWPVYLLWHSNWWRISISLETNHKIKIIKLFLVWSAWVKRSLSFKQKLVSLFAKSLKPLKNFPWATKARSLFYRAIWGQDYLNCNDDNIKNTFLNVLESNLELEMTQITTPTELIWWDGDTYTPLKDWRLISALIKKSNLTILPWEKHWIHLHSPDKLFQVIKSKLINYT